MKDGSIVAISYTGKIVATGEMFESTVEKKAIEGGIFSPKQKYLPMIVVAGEGDVLPGLEKALLEMKLGEERKILVKPAGGWGERSPDNIAVVPLQQFKEHKIAPVPGLVLEVNGRQGRVQSVSGGRVRVDFNHPLAGKELEYELKIESEISEPKEQVRALYEKYFFMVPEAEKKLKIEQGRVEVTLSPRYSANIVPLKQLFSSIVTKHVKGFEKVSFVEEFKKEKEGGKKEDSAAAGEAAKHAEKSEGKKQGAAETTARQGVEKPGESRKTAEKPAEKSRAKSSGT
ncbi:MAG: peptidylprolyl isomerase [Candidatus Diapherotrites archaeon]|nr:peptidylprolyl isomerase [Candidatus Diapherotrites archaeon]